LLLLLLGIVLGGCGPNCTTILYWPRFKLERYVPAMCVVQGAQILLQFIDKHSSHNLVNSARNIGVRHNHL